MKEKVKYPHFTTLNVVAEKYLAQKRFFELYQQTVRNCLDDGDYDFKTNHNLAIFLDKLVSLHIFCDYLNIDLVELLKTNTFCKNPQKAIKRVWGKIFGNFLKIDEKRTDPKIKDYFTKWVGPIFYFCEQLTTYRWSTDELRKNARKKALNPSILGTIHQNTMNSDLQESTGSYYTPVEITTHICEKAIEQSLKLKGKENSGNLKRRLKKISELSVLDNACGCGAFLIAACGILERKWGECIEKIRAKEEPTEIKAIWKTQRENAIASQNSILNEDVCLRKYIVSELVYGVELQPHPLKISKLR